MGLSRMRTARVPRPPRTAKARIGRQSSCHSHNVMAAKGVFSAKVLAPQRLSLPALGCRWWRAVPVRPFAVSNCRCRRATYREGPLGAGASICARATSRYRAGRAPCVGPEAHARSATFKFRNSTADLRPAIGLLRSVERQQQIQVSHAKLSGFPHVAASSGSAMNDRR